MIFLVYVESPSYCCSFFVGLYLSKKINSVDDVYEWFLSLDNDYVTYADIFKKRNIDGYWLLNQIDDGRLITYGVENQDHRRRILDGIEKLREKCPEQFSVSQTWEMIFFRFHKVSTKNMILYQAISYISVIFSKNIISILSWKQVYNWRWWK